MTDANPSSYGGEDLALIDLTKKLAESKEHIYTTFIGMGLDFNIELVNKIVKSRGTNYFSVQSSREFKKILVEDFNYIVTPIVFNMDLQLESQAIKVLENYGVEYDRDTGSI